MSTHPTTPGPVVHRGTIDSFAPVACDGSPIEVHSPLIFSGRLVPSQVMIGTEKTTGMQIVNASMLHVPTHLPATAVAVVLAVQVGWPTKPAISVSNIR